MSVELIDRVNAIVEELQDNGRDADVLSCKMAAAPGFPGGISGGTKAALNIKFLY